MTNTHELTEYGQLAELAYLRLESEYSKIAFKNKLYSNVLLKKYLLVTEEHINEVVKENVFDRNILDKYNPFYYKDVAAYTGINSDRVDTMLSVLKNYELLDFKSDIQYDFQGMLFKHKESGEFVIAFRGTAGLKDIIVDSKIALLTSNHNDQYRAAFIFLNDMKTKYKKYGFTYDNLTLTGHSLGGILAQALGSKYKIPTFAYNPLGTSLLDKSQGVAFSVISGKSSINILAEVYVALKLDIQTDDEWMNDNIITISYNDDGLLNGDILSNYATHINGSKHIGSKIDIFGKDVGIGAGHSIITLNKLLELQDKNKPTTIDDIQKFNKNQKTLFLEIMLRKKVDILLVQAKKEKFIYSIQMQEEIHSLVETSSEGFSKYIKDSKLESLMINSNIKVLENRENFHNKLYYHPSNNKLKVKTKSFKDASLLIKPFIYYNKNLKKHDIKVQIEDRY